VTAVAADSPDDGVPGHYGDPLREQRRLVTAAGLVDRSNRPVLAIRGPDRLAWLHTLTSQHLSGLASSTGSEALVLSPHGHVEHHLVLADDGETTWLDVEPGTAEPLLGYLTAMRFLFRVEVHDVTAEWAVATLVGRETPVQVPATPYAVVALPGGGFARRMPALRDGVPVIDLVAPRGAVPEVAPPAGLWAWDALRVESCRPRLGVDTDHRTIPHEVGWVGTAVHLDKGCYRGQETVARVHNLGRPPRRLVVLHLDGSAERLPARHAPVEVDGRPVGFLGTAARHHELGAVALALVKRAVGDDAELVADGVPARIDPTLSLAPGAPALARPRLG
jgi:folate-binding protein YgfZ